MLRLPLNTHHIAAYKDAFHPSSHKGLQRNFVTRRCRPDFLTRTVSFESPAIKQPSWIPLEYVWLSVSLPTDTSLIRMIILSHVRIDFVLRLLILRIYFCLRDESINIWQPEWANHSPHALVSAPKAFANSPPFSRAAQTSVYEPLKLFLKIISPYHNRLADSALLFSIIINEAGIVIFSSQIIHSHYMCRVKWMVFNKEEESPRAAAGLRNKVRCNALLKHIAMLRERKLAIHHARLTSMRCCPTATVGPGVRTHTPFYIFSALCFTAVFNQEADVVYGVNAAAINCSWLG